MRNQIRYLLISALLLLFTSVGAVADMPTGDGWDFTVSKVYGDEHGRVCVEVANISQDITDAYPKGMDGNVTVLLKVPSLDSLSRTQTIFIEQGTSEVAFFDLPPSAVEPGAVLPLSLNVTVELWGGATNDWEFFGPQDFVVSFVL